MPLIDNCKITLNVHDRHFLYSRVGRLNSYKFTFLVADSRPNYVKAKYFSKNVHTENKKERN